MYPAIFYTLKMLDIQILATNSKHFANNRYIKLWQKFGNPENRRTFASVP